MIQTAIDLSCPSCGAPTNTGAKTCPYCSRPIVISTFRSVLEMSLPELNKYSRSYQSALTDHPNDSQLRKSSGFCFLALKLYDKALAAFEDVIQTDFNDSEAYFYAAMCLLNRKKAYLASRPIIDKIEEYINAAIMIEPLGIYYYFYAYIKYDYFARKYFVTSPTYEELLREATDNGLSDYDISQVFLILNVDRPDEL